MHNDKELHKLELEKLHSLLPAIAQGRQGWGNLGLRAPPHGQISKGTARMCPVLSLCILYLVTLKVKECLFTQFIQSVSDPKLTFPALVLEQLLNLELSSILYTVT